MSKIIFIVISIIVLLNVCRDVDNSDKSIPNFLTRYFSGNGELFSYCIYKFDQASTFIVNREGEILNHIISEDKNINDCSSSFIDNQLYIVRYFHNEHKSTMRKCDLVNYNCTDFYNSGGSIRCIFKYRERIFFFQSDFMPEGHRHAGYVNYKLKSISRAGGDEQIHFDTPVAISVCPIIDEETIYASMYMGIDPSSLIDREDITLRWKNNKFVATRELGAVDRVSSVYLFNSADDMKYVTQSNDYGYLSGLCLDITQCIIKEGQTNPVFVDGKYYYGVWDDVEQKISIKEWVEMEN